MTSNVVMMYASLHTCSSPGEIAQCSEEIISAMLDYLLSDRKSVPTKVTKAVGGVPPRAVAGSSRTRWVVCGFLFLATTINYLDRSVLSLIEPALHDLPFMGWNLQQDVAHQDVFNNHFGNIVTCFVLAYGIGLFWAGRVIDRIGTKAGYAIAVCVWAAASISHSLVGSVLGFCVARFVLGLGEAGNFPAAVKATMEWFPTQERGLVTGIFNSGTSVASFIAPLVIPFVTIRYGWRAAFLVTGSCGVIWLVAWMLFPYKRMVHEFGQTHVAVEATTAGRSIYRAIARKRGLYAFAAGKLLTDPIWWFYLFWLPKYFHENYNLDLQHLGPPLIVVYVCSSFGSIGGGWLSGFRMKHGSGVNAGRKSVMLLCACAALPVMLVPALHRLYPHNVWPVVALFALAVAAHQGWSSNLYSTPSDMFPAAQVSTVAGVGAAVGAVGGAVFTQITKIIWNTHPFLIFLTGSLAYLVALGVFHLLVPHLGEQEHGLVDS